MPNDDNWKNAPAQVYMNPDDFRDMVVMVLCAEGWTEDDALAEADRRMAEMLPPPGEPDPMITALADKLEAGEG